MSQMASHSAYSYTEHENDSLGLDPSSPFFLDHVSRYWWAAERFAQGKRALDCACGHGYGSYILANHASSVLGVDLNAGSLRAAQTTFGSPNLEFRSQDLLQLGQVKEKFGLVTAFEVIEHLPSETMDAFLGGVASVLVDSGVFLVSTPNHDVVTKSGVHVPEFHINNLKPRELEAILSRHFGRVELLGQFAPRRGLQGLAFHLDHLNLRHSLARWLKSMKSARKRSASPAQPQDQTQAKPSVSSETVRSWFEKPTPEMRAYQFSRWHWRQAGLSVAVCSRPKR